MRDYLKILSSIIAALLSMAFLVSAVVGIVALISGNPEIASAVLFPFVFAWVGFVMFGIIGSLFWFGFLRASYTLSLGPVKRQILASLLSTLVSWLTIASIFSHGQFRQVIEAAPLLVFVVPVVVVSLLWYRFLYLRPKLNNANHGER